MIASTISPLILASALAAGVPAQEPLACRLDALTSAQRARHRQLSESLAKAVVGSRELSGGYELELDLSRLPADAKGDPYCIVEVAEWVDLEARCCPFLDFGIGVRGVGGAIRLSLSGGPGVKEFLRMAFPLLEEKAHDILPK